MSRTIFRTGPKRSPNTPPRAPAKMAPKEQTLLTMDLVIHGNQIENNGKFMTNVSNELDKHVKNGGLNTSVRPRPHTAHVDKHVLKSLSRTPSVDSSFYDKFERLDRDSVIDDIAYKEKGGLNRQKNQRGQSKSRPTSARVRHTKTSTKSKRRSKSANPTTRHHECSIPNVGKATCSHKPSKERPKSAGTAPRPSATSTGIFFETLMSFDDETKQNTLTNAVRQISPRTVLNKNRHYQTAQNTHPNNRPKSGRKSRERVPSNKHGERRNSIASRSSTGSASNCSSRSGRNDKRLSRRSRSRKSRSRTRRTTQQTKFSEYGCSSKRNSSQINAERHKADILRQKMVAMTINALPNDEVVSAPVTSQTGSFAYSYNHVRPPSGKKKSPSKCSRLPTTSALINAVHTANTAQENMEMQLSCFNNNDFIHSYQRPVTSSVPKLKMIVAPTATPMASMIRTSGTKVLTSQCYYENKRTF